MSQLPQLVVNKPVDTVDKRMSYEFNFRVYPPADGESLTESLPMTPEILGDGSVYNATLDLTKYKTVSSLTII